MNTSIRKFFQMFGQMLFKNTLIRQEGIISIYIWLLYLSFTAIADMATLISTIPNVDNNKRNYVIIELSLITETILLLILYKKLTKNYRPLREAIGVAVAYTQAIFIVESALYYDKTAAQFLIYFSTISFGALLIFYDTVPTLLRATIYYIIIYGYGIITVFTKKIDFTSTISYKRFVICYLYLFFIGLSGIYSVLYHRYLNLINIIGLEQTYSTSIKLMGFSGVGVSVENKDHIIFRNNVFCSKFNEKKLMDDDYSKMVNKREDHLEISKRIMFLASSIYDVYIVRDFTEITRAEQEKYFQMLIATITHELRTPLNIIMSIFHVIKERITDQILQEEIDKGLSASAMQENLINDILDLAKLSHGQLQLNIQQTNIKEVIKSVYSLFKYKVGKSIDFQYFIDNSVPDCILIDERRYKQVLLNLLSNSSKFTTQGSILLKVLYKEAQLYTTVIDSGIGIEKQDHDKIFKQFGMIKSAGYLNKGGTGLGLNLCQNLVFKMGGEITFDSVPNKKTDFTFYIKASKVERKRENRTLFPKTIHKILIVDDNFMNIAVLETFCKKAGVIYLSFHNSEDVLKRVSELSEDYIGLLDLHMPKIDGFSLAQLLKQVNSDMVLYAVSGDDREQILSKCRQCGFRDVIEKPISYEKFAALLDS